MSEARKTRRPCKWLREHRASTKADAVLRMTDSAGQNYLRLESGQVVREAVARKLGIRPGIKGAAA